MAQTPEETGGRRNFTPQQTGLVIGGLVVLLALLWFVFLRGDGAAEPVAQDAPPVTQTAPEPEPDADADAGKTKGSSKPKKGQVETFEVFAPRDPFEPLVKPGGGDAGGTSGSAGDGSGGSGSGSGSGSGGESIGGHRVKLVDVFKKNGSQRAQVQIDGTVYTVEEGETFADNFQVLSISGTCATMLFGDDQFTLCEGEEILK